MSIAARIVLLVVALAGCSDTLDATQVMVIIDAEPGVRTRSEKLHIVVEGSGGRSDLNERAPYDRTFAVGAETLVWPHLTALTPLKGDVGRVYTITATALDSADGFVAQVRAISGYVEHKALALPLLLQERCLNKMCSEKQTCHEGTCADADVDAATLLPLGGSDVSVGGMDGSGGGGGDTVLPTTDGGAGTGGTGAGTGGSATGGAGGAGGASSDASTSDAATDAATTIDAGHDAGPPPPPPGKTCDACETNADCATDYVCQDRLNEGVRVCLLLASSLSTGTYCPDLEPKGQFGSTGCAGPCNTHPAICPPKTTCVQWKATYAGMTTY